MSSGSKSDMEKVKKNMEEKLKQVEKACICRDCPTYASLGEPDDYIAYCHPLRGKSKKITEEVGCQCPDCPVWTEMKFTKVYFCTRGTEKQQKEAKNK